MMHTVQVLMILEVFCTMGLNTYSVPVIELYLYYH